MKVEELKSEGLNRGFKVTITAADIDTHIDERLLEVGKTVKLPGFRPGKVPMDLLKQRYGKAVLGEVLEKAVNDTSTKIIADKKLQPAMKPKIEVKEFDEGKDLVYTMDLEVLPEFDVIDLKGVKVEKPVAKVEDKEIDEALERIAGQRKDSKPIEGKRGAKEGDIVVIDFKGRTADGTEYPGMASDGHQLELGSGQFIPGFEEQIVGTRAGDDVEVKVTFPEKYQMADLAGKDAIFDVKLHEIREPQKMEVGEELAKTIGFEDLKALRAAVEEQIGREFDQLSRMKVKRALLDQLDETHTFDVPQGMLDMEFESILRQVEHEKHQHAHAHGDHDHDCETAHSVSDEEKEELREIANRRVRLGLVLSRIGNENNIQVSDQELQRAVINEAQRYQGQEREVFDYFQKNPQALEGLRAPLFEDKVVDFILELAQVEEKTVSAEELAKDDDEEEAAKPKKKTPAKKSSSKAKSEGKSEDKPAAEKKKPAAKKKAPAKKKAASK